MFSFSPWIAVNKVANFCVLLLVCWYLIRQRLYPVIQKIVEQRAADSGQLRQTLVAIAQKNSELLQAIDAQEKQAQLLLTKIEVWKTTVAVKEEQADAQRLLLEQKCLMYLKKRADGLCQEQLRREILPVVFKKTHAQVVTFFKEEGAQAGYINDLLNGLPKGKMHG